MVLVEHDMNDIVFFSPGDFGIKPSRGSGLSARALGNQYSRRLDAVSKHGAVLASSESCFSVLCSPRLSTKKDGTNMVKCSTPSEKKIESSGMGLASESNSM